MNIFLKSKKNLINNVVDRCNTSKLTVSKSRNRWRRKVKLKPSLVFIELCEICCNTSVTKAIHKYIHTYIERQNCRGGREREKNIPSTVDLPFPPSAAMRIRKHAKLVGLSLTTTTALADLTPQSSSRFHSPHVCQLNQSPWDLLSFPPDSPSSPFQVSLPLSLSLSLLN